MLPCLQLPNRSSRSREDSPFSPVVGADPFFEDFIGRRNNLQWTGKDFLAGHNVSAIVLELANSELGSHPPVGIWARVCVPHGQGEFPQADGVGRPLANVTFNRGDKEAQNVFNQSQPAEDRRLFLDRFASYLQGTGHSADEAAAVAATLLPDMLAYDWTSQSLFPNGRTLTDDVSDWTWALLTKGQSRMTESVRILACCRTFRTSAPLMRTHRW